MSCRLCSITTVLICFSAFSSLATAADRFSMTIDSKNHLVILGSKGEQAADITNPSIATPVTVGSASFQVSFGRDANDLLTAIVTPSSSQPQDLHFSVLGKKIDSDKQAVVTLTFPSSDRVIIDPGYVGTVTVNDEKLKAHHFVDNHPVSTPVTAPTPTAMAAIEQPRETAPFVAAAPAPVENTKGYSLPVAQPEAAAPAPVVNSPTRTDVAGIEMNGSEADTSSIQDDKAISQIVAPNPARTTSILPPPLMGSLVAQPPTPFTSNMSAPGTSSNGRLYWSEPVTPPNGPAPKVGVDSMKLVEVQGPVEIKLADGTTKPGENGMIIPSGSIVETAAGGSAAVFMGGVNSARFLPDTEAKINQSLSDDVRHTTIDLQKGTVFSRIGRRSGETQDYKVKTPEGVAAARGTETVDHRGLGSDGKMHHYVFVATGTVETFIAGQVGKVITGTYGSVGGASMPTANDDAQILQAILVALQPYDVKLAGVLSRIANGTASPGDVAFYNALVNIFFDQQLPGMIDTFQDYANIFTDILPMARRAVNQDLQPFGTVPLTPF